MGHEPEASPGVCSCPPACLALLGNEKIVLEKVQKIFIDEARELQSRLREQLSQVKAESGLFLRLMYKNKNQHRRSLYYRRLSEVRRDLQMLNSSGLDATVESFTKFFDSKRPDGVLSKAATRFKPKDAIDESKGLCILLGVARLLNQSDGPIMASSVQLTGLLGQSFFMPFALTMLSCLARFRVLLTQVLYEVVTAFNLLSALLQKQKKVSVSFPGQSLPVQLECQWDGVKLCMTEKKPASVQQSKRIDSHILAEVAPLWCVDDRTGVKYDLGVPTAIAGSGGEEVHANELATSNVNKGSLFRVHEMERTASLGLDLEDVSPYMCRLDPGEDIARPSGEDILPPAINCSGTVDNVEVREPSGHGLDSSPRNASYKQDSRTSSALEKSVAYISVSYQIPRELMSRGEMVQTLQGHSTGDGADRAVKQEVKDVQVFGFEGCRRLSRVWGTESVTETNLVSVDRANGMPSILPVSSNSDSMEVVESGTSKEELENLKVSQEINSGPIQRTRVDCHGLKSAFSEEIDTNNQADAAVSSSRPLEEIDAKDAFQTSLPNRAIIENSHTVQTSSFELRTTLDYNADHADLKFLALDRLGERSMTTSQQDGTGGDGPTTVEGSKANAVIIENSQNSSVDQNGSMKMMLTRPGSVSLEEKAGCLDVPSSQINIEGAIVTSGSLEGKNELERTPDQFVEENLEATCLGMDFESNHLDVPNANLSITSNPGLAIVIEVCPPTTVHVEGEVQISSSGLSNVLDRSKVLGKDVTLKNACPSISIIPELNSSCKDDRCKAVFEEYQAGHDNHTNLPENMNSEEAAEQGFRKNASPSSPSRSHRAKSGVKRPVAYVPVGAGGRTSQKKRKGYDDGKRTDRDKKQQLPSGLKDSPIAFEAKRGIVENKDTCCESESKKKKANDIFAMLLGRSD